MEAEVAALRAQVLAHEGALLLQQQRVKAQQAQQAARGPLGGSQHPFISFAGTKISSLLVPKYLTSATCCSS